MITQLNRFLRCVLCSSLGALLVTGCENGPRRLDLPEYETNAGQAAIAAYDTNKDGKISGDELPHSPALNSTLARIDSNQDRAITAEEIDARIRQWRESRVALMPVSCKIRLDGSPVANVRVTLEPEAFLGSSVSAAHGVSDQDGVAVLSIPADRLANPRLTGVAPGFYRIVAEVEKDGMLIRYTTGPRTGCEVAPDAPWAGEGIVVAEFTAR